MDELREAFDKAWDKSEKDNETVVPVDEPVDEPKEEPAAELEPEKEGEEEPSQDGDLNDEPDPNAEPQETPAGEAPKEKAASSKAPAGWSPTNREQWANIPDSVKEQITKREKEIDLALKKTTEERRVAQQLAKTVQPYQQAMVAAGYQDPFQAIDTLMRTESMLRGGTVQEKAETIGRLIHQYGVDIQALDGILAGQPQQPSQNSELEQLLDQRLAPVQQYMQQVQQTQQMAAQQQQAEAQQQVQQFSAEFFDDVRMDMADLMDMAAKRGVEMTLQDAYDKACALHPEISKVVKQREAEQRLIEAGQQAAKKKAAASASLTGRQSGVPAKDGGGSLRDTIADVWSDVHG